MQAPVVASGVLFCRPERKQGVPQYLRALGKQGKRGLPDKEGPFWGANRGGSFAMFRNSC